MPVLNGVSFFYRSFKRVAVSGETGSGKTTLLKLIAGLLQPDEGAVFFEDERVLGPNEKLLPGHPRIAYLSQHFELRNNYRVGDYLEMASKMEEPERNRIYELCQVDHLLMRRTDQLSGGERQRTALARLLTTSPRLLLLDEPYSNLDGIHKQILKTVIDNIVEEGKTSCLMVSHDPVDVLPWAEEVLVLKDGNIVQKAAPETIYRQPVSAYAGGLFGDYNLLSAQKGADVFGLNGNGAGQQLFVRPENIQLSKSGNDDAGVVEAVYFFGSYYELDVRFPGTKLLVKTNGTGLQKGDRVNASAAAEDVWYLK
ncbi:MAG TPA: ABC transporter ATP-binding protein [Flavisolibacter sp.]|nr:ABC transporter ATP-binding protein [Flavisolibacter sp.]